MNNTKEERMEDRKQRSGNIMSIAQKELARFAALEFEVRSPKNENAVKESASKFNCPGKPPQHIQQKTAYVVL